MQTNPITVNHTGRIARSKPTALCPTGMLWSRDMRFFFANVPAGEYTLELLMKETQRFDAGASDTSRPVVDIYVNNRLAAREATVQTVQPDDPYAVLPVAVQVSRLGFDVRIYAVRGGLNIPALCGMRLRRDEEIIYSFLAGDAAERAMWTPAEMDSDAGSTRCARYEELLHSGVPLGGIGTGRLELLTNGTLGSFSCNNNWDIPTYWTEGAFFALRAVAGAKSQAMLLHPPRTAGGYGLPTVDAVNYLGRFPAAELSYEIAQFPTLDVHLHAQGTLTPGDNALSALPAATFTFTLTNTSDAPVDISLLMSMENLCGQGGYSYIKEDWSASYRERFDSVTGACQRPWDKDGMTGVLLTNTRTPCDLREANAFTDFLLACEDEATSRCLGWNVDAAQPAFWAQFAENGELSAGDAEAMGVDGTYRPAAALAQQRRIEPGHFAEISFVLAWYHHGHTTFRDATDHGHAYQRACANVGEVAQRVLTQQETMTEGVDHWQELLQHSTLPMWLQTKLINGAFPTTTNTVWTNDDLFSVHESPTEMCGAVGTIDQRMAAHPFTFAFFPELDRCELDWFRRCQQPDGQIPHMIGNVYDRLGSADTFFCVTNWPDLSCSFILQTYRHFLYSGDRAYLEQNFPAYARAIAWMQSTDTLGLGLPIGGCTYDYEQHEWKVGAPMIFNAVCYLGALRAAIDAAGRLGREEERAAWQTAFDKAHDTLMTRYWNGQYFRKWLHPEEGIESPNCFVAQLAGDWFVRLLGLEPLFSDEIVDSVLESIVRLNARPHYPTILMEATPEGAIATETCYVQQHEPYLGMELIYRGRVQMGLEVLHRRQEISWRVNSNPWGEALAVAAPGGQEMLLFDYMTAAAGWNVLYALTGMTVDAENGLLHFRPQLSGARACRIPVFLPDLWLMLDIDIDRSEPAWLEVEHRGEHAPCFEKITVELCGVEYEVPAIESYSVSDFEGELV